MWVDTSGLRQKREAKGRGNSRRNAAEVEVVHALLARLLKSTPSDLSIGVITTYSEQRDFLRRRLARYMRGPRSIEVDTVDSFEGRECDIVLVSLVRSNARGDVGFLKQVQRINVALSRARRMLIVVGDTSTLKEGCFATLQQLLSHNRALVDVGRIVRHFGRPARQVSSDASRCHSAESASPETQPADKESRPEPATTAVA